VAPIYLEDSARERIKKARQNPQRIHVMIVSVYDAVAELNP